jgi:hypothetical protein
MNNKLKDLLPFTRPKKIWLIALAMAISLGVLLVSIDSSAIAIGSTTDKNKRENTLKPTLEIINEILSGIQSLATIAGIIVGGAWIYLNTFRGRLYRFRIELSVSASLTPSRIGPVISITSSARNVGLSQVVLDKGSIHVEVLELRRPGSLPWVYEEKDLRPLGISQQFQDHNCIEPAEVIYDVSIFAVPDTQANIYLIRLFMQNKNNTIEWSASCVTSCKDGMYHPLEIWPK